MSTIDSTSEVQSLIKQHRSPNHTDPKAARPSMTTVSQNFISNKMLSADAKPNKKRYVNQRKSIIYRKYYGNQRKSIIGPILHREQYDVKLNKNRYANKSILKTENYRIS
jgi:hypothetical protein